MKKIVNLENADRVTKKYLIDSLMVEKEFSREDAEKAVNGIIDAAVTAFVAGASLTLSNFGTLRPVTVPPTARRNPVTGETFTAPETGTVRWTPSPTLVAYLSGRINRETLSVKAPQSR